MKITHYFFNNSIGIVRTVDENTSETKYYSGSIAALNSTPEKDAEYLAQWGNRFPNVAGDALYNNYFMTVYVGV